MKEVEPEREMVRRALPIGSAAVVLAFAVGTAVGGIDAGFSASLGALVVVGNFAANGYSLAWASGVSPNFVGVVAALGFVVRMAVFFGVLLALRLTEFFSPPAFVLAAAPTLIVLLGFEAKLMMGPMGREIRIPEHQVSR